MCSTMKLICTVEVLRHLQNVSDDFTAEMVNEFPAIVRHMDV